MHEKIQELLSPGVLLIGNGVISTCIIVSVVVPRICILSNETSRVSLGDSGPQEANTSIPEYCHSRHHWFKWWPLY